MKNEEGKVKLSDGSVLKMRIAIIDARETGFSPFGGVNMSVKVTGGVASLDIPEELRRKVSDKPHPPPGPEPPRDGWEIVDIAGYDPACAEERVETPKGPFLVIVKAEPVMASRNVNYRSELDEPIYWINWVYKISWKPLKEEEGNVS